MRQSLKDLTFSDNSEWFGMGPLALAILAGVRAFTADESFARWAWSVIAVLMLVLCAVYLVWVRTKRPEPGAEVD